MITASPRHCEEQQDAAIQYFVIASAARQGLINDFTGISSPYEAPDTPELTIDTANLPLETCVDKFIELLRLQGRIFQAAPFFES